MSFLLFGVWSVWCWSRCDCDTVYLYMFDLKTECLSQYTLDKENLLLQDSVTVNHIVDNNKWTMGYNVHSNHHNIQLDDQNNSHT